MSKTSVFKKIRTVGTVIGVSTSLLFVNSSNANAEEMLRHETIFNVKFGSLLIGQMSFDIDADKINYVLRGKGRTKGIAEWFASGNAIIKSQGELAGDKVVAASHMISVTDKKTTATLDMALEQGNVINVAMKPDRTKRHLAPNHIEITADELKNVIDPASTLVVPVPWEVANNPLSVCGQLFRVYDGETRYNMQLSYKRNARIKTTGYNGYAYVCRLKYIPVAGHRKNHRNSKRMADNNDMEIWLAPIAATNLFTPIRIVVPTWLGSFYAEPEYFGPAKS